MPAMNRSRIGLVKPASVGIALVMAAPQCSVIPAKAGIQGVAYGLQNDPQTPRPVSTSIFIPWRAGTSRHERLARKYVAPAKLMSPGRSEGRP